MTVTGLHEVVQTQRLASESLRTTTQIMETGRTGGRQDTMAKNNIRSIRFSDELAELIDRQQGKNFQQKFENLITRCVYELPQKEAEIARLDKLKAEKQKQLSEMSEQLYELRTTIGDLTHRITALEAAVKRNIQKYEK